MSRGIVLTEQCVLEHAIWLDLVKRCLEETFLFQLIIVIVIDRTELLCLILVSLRLEHQEWCIYLFIQEVEISGTLVLDILGLVRLVVPVSFLFPLLVFLFFELS